MKPAASKAEALTNNRDHGRIVTLSTKLLKSLVIAPTLIIIPKTDTRNRTWRAADDFVGQCPQIAHEPSDEAAYAAAPG